MTQKPGGNQCINEQQVLFQRHLQQYLLPGSDESCGGGSLEYQLHLGRLIGSLAASPPSLKHEPATQISSVSNRQLSSQQLNIQQMASCLLPNRQLSSQLWSSQQLSGQQNTHALSCRQLGVHSSYVDSLPAQPQQNALQPSMSLQSVDLAGPQFQDQLAHHLLHPDPTNQTSSMKQQALDQSLGGQYSAFTLPFQSYSRQVSQLQRSGNCETSNFQTFEYSRMGRQMSDTLTAEHDPCQPIDWHNLSKLQRSGIPDLEVPEFAQNAPSPPGSLTNVRHRSTFQQLSSSRSTGMLDAFYSEHLHHTSSGQSTSLTGMQHPEDTAVRSYSSGLLSGAGTYEESALDAEEMADKSAVNVLQHWLGDRQELSVITLPMTPAPELEDLDFIADFWNVDQQL